MARVHMFKSSDKQTKDIVAADNVPASPSIPNKTTEENVVETVKEPAKSSVHTNEENMVSILQKASNDMDVAGAVAAALSIKPPILNEETQQQLLSTLQEHHLDEKQDKEKEKVANTLESDASVNQKESHPGNDVETTGSLQDNSTEFMDQAAAATALQLLGLAQQQQQQNKELNESGTAAEGVGEHEAPNDKSLENVMAIASQYMKLKTMNNSPDIAVEELSQKRGAWTQEEDELLLSGIKKHGYGRWKEIAAMIPGRKGKQLKQRWDNSLAAKYVDQELLESKVNQPETESSSKAAAALSSLDLADWTKKLCDKLKEGDQATLESLLSQALLSSIQSAASSSSSSSETTNTANIQNALNFSDPLLLFPNLLLQQKQQQKPPQAAGDETSSSSFFIPNMEEGSSYKASSNRKRRRSDPALANTQSDAISIYASSSPITTTVDNQTQTVYPCLFPGCEKKFARLYNLKSHSRTHTDDRPFVCNMCHLAFSRNHDLKRHSKIHGGAKPYHCPGCNKSFSRLDALKRHKSNQRNKATCVGTSTSPQQEQTQYQPL